MGRPPFNFPLNGPAVPSRWAPRASVGLTKRLSELGRASRARSVLQKPSIYFFLDALCSGSAGGAVAASRASSCRTLFDTRGARREQARTRLVSRVARRRIARSEN